MVAGHSKEPGYRLDGVVISLYKTHGDRDGADGDFKLIISLAKKGKGVSREKGPIQVHPSGDECGLCDVILVIVASVVASPKHWLFNSIFGF